MKKNFLSKTEGSLLIIGIVVGGIFSKFLNIHNWVYEAHFNLISYNPHVPFIGLGIGWFYLLILLGSRGNARKLIIPTIIGLIYDIILMYGVFQTYTPMYEELSRLLIYEVLLLGGVTWAVVKD